MSRPKRGIVLAGGGPLGGIWETGGLVALDEALVGIDFIACDVLDAASAAAIKPRGVMPR